MKNRYSIYPNRSRGGIYYLKDSEIGLRESLHTPDEDRALELLMAKKEAEREPAHNLQKARVYLAASDPKAAKRTWQDALDGVIASKPEGSENRQRWERFALDEALEPILGVVLLQTKPDQLLAVATAPTVSTNVFLRRLHNFCIGMIWLPWPILAPKLWPKVKYKKKRSTKHDEHLRIIARERNPDLRSFYELCWELGGSQSDIGHLEGEDVDWIDGTVCYDRQKLASLDETDIKPPLIRIGKRCAASKGLGGVSICLLLFCQLSRRSATDTYVRGMHSADRRQCSI